MRAGRAHPIRRGFSLLEALVVLALLALVIGVTAPAMGRFLAEDAERRQIVDLVNLLQSERTEAIRLGRSVRVALEHEGATLIVRRRGEERRWSDWGSQLLETDERRTPTMRDALVFEPSGRTTTRLILFESQETSDRIWEIGFDPVSGVPSLRERAEGESETPAAPRRRTSQ